MSLRESKSCWNEVKVGISLSTSRLHMNTWFCCGRNYTKVFNAHRLSIISLLLWENTGEGSTINPWFAILGSRYKIRCYIQIFLHHWKENFTPGVAEHTQRLLLHMKKVISMFCCEDEEMPTCYSEIPVTS